MDKLLVVKQLWVDTLENEVNSAYGYKIIGFCTDPKVVEKLKTISIPKSTYPWPLEYAVGGDDVPVFRFQEVKLIDNADEIISNFKL